MEKQPMGSDDFTDITPPSKQSEPPALLGPGEAMEQLFPFIEYRWDEIQELLDEFHSLLSERVPRVRIERQEDVLDWEQQTGVYLLFGPDDELLYVGHTRRGFEGRKKYHERCFEHTHMDLIVFPPEFGFFAPALEVFLNERLQPRFSGYPKSKYI
jgi:hypothetical protein